VARGDVLRLPPERASNVRSAATGGVAAFAQSPRREFIRGAGASAAAIGAALVPAGPAGALAKKAQEAAAAQGTIYGIDEDAPFRSALNQIAGLLDKLGIDGAVQKTVEIQLGPPIERKYTIGIKPRSDRLRVCEDGKGACVSSSRNERSEYAICPFVYFSQKGDAVGDLIESLYGVRDAQLLAANGNFFNGAGVYVLAELTDRNGPQNLETIHDVEFQFLPGVLENIVDVRIIARDGPSNAARQRYLLESLGSALGWVPLALEEDKLAALEKLQREVFNASRIEMGFRDKFEDSMEQADADLEVQMQKEAKKIVELKAEISRLLNAIDAQENARLNEYTELRSRTAQTRQQYEDGVTGRLGGYANTGTYAPGQAIRMGNSFAGLINTQDDVMSKVYQNAQKGNALPPVKK